jgi:putative endonuclease
LADKEVERLATLFMFFVYAIYNQKYKKVYIGQTEDIDTRLRAHNTKEFKSSYTARFDGEWKLIYKESLPSRNEAIRREKQLKSYQGRMFLKQYIPQ